MIVRIVLSPKAEEAYGRLRTSTRKEDRTVLHSLLSKIELIKEDMHYGNPMAKRLIPREYQDSYGITNLFRVEIALFWRMLYTLVHDEQGIVVFVLDLMSHGDYDKMFGYRRK